MQHETSNAGKGNVEAVSVAIPAVMRTGVDGKNVQQIFFPIISRPKISVLCHFWRIFLLECDFFHISVLSVILKTKNKILYFDPTIQFMYLIEKYRVLILDIYKVCILMIISYFNIIWLFGSLEKIFLCLFKFFIMFCLHCFFILIDYHNHY